MKNENAYDNSIIKEHLGDSLSEILFNGHLEYSASNNPEILGHALRDYFHQAGGNVRRDSPELFSIYSGAADAGFQEQEILLSPTAFSFYRGLGCIPEQFTDIYNCYFDSEIIHLGNNEVFVDGGAQDLFTSYRFAKKVHNQYNGIYAFEPDEKNYYECMGNKVLFDGDIHISAVALSDKTCFLGFTGDKQNSHVDGESSLLVQGAALDDCLEEIYPTFIKLHLEGSEFAATLGAEKIIRSCQPKLAICIDHCLEDITRIPMKILEFCSDYKLYLRHYSTTITETVLYAIKQ